MILLTGNTGFIGSALSNRFYNSGFKFITLSRSISNNVDQGIFHHQLDINSEYEWIDVVSGVKTIVHAAGKAHAEINTTNKHEFTETNLDSTLRFARKAAISGIHRFIYFSTFNINGLYSNNLVSENDNVAPTDLAAEMKLEAEEGLKQIAIETGMNVVIIRLPLVYGAGVKANFLNLLKLSNTGLPLPFGVVNNKRSMIYVENLVDFTVKCIDHPAAENQTFLISDGHDLSLRRLLKLIRYSMNRPARLIPVPVLLFKLVGFIFRKKDVVVRLLGNLQVDSSKAMTLLNWEPPYTVEEGIQATVDSFLEN